MGSWPLWRAREPIKEVVGFEPLLAQWEKATHPAQQRLEAYLAWIASQLSPLPTGPEPLFLDLQVDVHERSRLTHHYDLENYLTPLFGRKYLAPSRFVIVTAQKKVGGGSHIAIGPVQAITKDEFGAGWGHFSYRTKRGADTWKASLRSALIASNPEPLPPGPVEVILAWRCSPRRNWVTFWKPTGDTLGPVLGEPLSTKPFSPNDDRIVRLALHRMPTENMGDALDIGMWWRPANS
jgi:hypothetical protein